MNPDEEKAGGRGRHMSVSHYANNTGGSISQPAGGRRTSIAPVGSFSQDTQKAGVLNQKDETFRKMSVAVPNLIELSKDASEAANKERNMGFLEGCRLYPKVRA